MTMQITKASRKQAKLRVGLSGPSGSGKTYSGLQLARGLATSWEKVLIIDSENGSGELYSDLGPYNVIKLDAPYTPERYIEAIKAGEDAGMEVILIDSTSHEWDGNGGCLELNEKLAAAKYKGNTWAAWSETTPRHQRFIQAITTSRCHIVTTARSKTETVQTEGKVKKIGMKEIQREGFEYELTVNFNIDREGHLAIASKDRTGLFISRDPFKIDVKVGKELLDWNESGVVDPMTLKREVRGHLERLGVELPPAEVMGAFMKFAMPSLTGLEWNEGNLAAIAAKLATITDMAAAQDALRPKPEPETPPAPAKQPEDVQVVTEEEAEPLTPADIPF